ncbi:MAG: hypothetical protein J0H09_12600 [Burkholderiales bacterium]|nr:hypothetical protein [Burkholderiales bacterium]ODU65618.1 MAG: hypothetical protein ABT05_05950 [Lautropia sp. SCN 66-9]
MSDKKHGSLPAADGVRRASHHRIDAEISRIETIPIRLPFKGDFKIASGGVRLGIDILIVRLHSRSGLVGIGETQAWLRQGSRETLASLNSIIHGHFAARVIGRSAFDAAAILSDLEEAVWHSNYAIAPIADAMLDLQGKILGVPAYELLGGRARESVAVGITLGIKKDLGALVAEARSRFEEGFTSFTVKVGEDLVRDAEAVRALCEGLGEAATIRADGNSGMDLAAAMKFMNRVKDLPLDAIEQPLPPWDLDGMAELALRYDIPMMADECVSAPEDLLAVIRKRAASVFQTKIAKNGGAWRCKALWEIGSAAGLRIFPGNHPGASVVTAAALHLATAWPGPLLEGPMAVGVNEILAEDVLTEPIRRVGKHMHAGDGPGLGIELDEEKLQRFRVDLV